MVKLIPVAIAGVMTTMGAASADEAGRNPAAWRAAHQMQGGVFTDAQRAEMNDLAYHSAASALCEGLILDRDRFEDRFAALTHSDDAKFSGPERAYHRTHLAVSFGVAVGVMLAEHVDDADLCEVAGSGSDLFPPRN